MERTLTWFVSKISILVFIYLILFFTYSGINSNYYEGDSLNYHIPIAKAYLEGGVWNPELIKGVPFLKYSPGSSEGILTGLLLLGIPINIFNIFGVIALFGACYILGQRFGLERNLSVIFASSIVTLHTIIRWLNTQVIDIWLAVWFVLALALLQKSEKSLKYFALLGFSLGMLVGSKYTGPLFLMVLALFYFRKVWKIVNFKRIIVFLIPFAFFGLLWYLRNFFVTGNPIYPQPFLFFKGDYYPILSTPVWDTTTKNIAGMMNFVNALISEYGLWSFAIFSPLILISKKLRNNQSFKQIKSLILIGSLSLVIFIFLPSDKYYNIVVSVFRYSYPAFISLILAIFLIARKFGREEQLGILALTNMIFIGGLQYTPKISLIILPIALFIFFPTKLLISFFSKIKSIVKIKNNNFNH